MTGLNTAVQSKIMLYCERIAWLEKEKEKAKNEINIFVIDRLIDILNEKIDSLSEDLYIYI